jgi:hypothetical protein
MNIRKIIREQISQVFKEVDATDAANDILGGTVNDIGAMLQQNIDNMNKIIATQQTTLKNDKAVYKQDSQKKNAISPKIGDIDNPEKKGLEREMPLRNQLNHAKEVQIKDLEDAAKGIESAKIDLDKKRLEIEKQAKEQSKASGKSSTQSVLPSLQSPI